jgi:hypothetical protein
LRSAVPQETATETHFYSAERADGSFDTTIETHLADVESKAAPVYKRLVSCLIPGYSQERADMAAFIALLYVRTPAMRREAGELIGKHIQIMNYAYGVHDEAFNTVVQGFEKKTGKTISVEEKKVLREGMIDPSPYILQIAKERTFVALSAADNLAPIIFDMKWTLLKPAHGFFFTSDNPVTRVVDPKTVHPIYGDHGFNNKTVEVTFPLSPDVMLLMTWDYTMPSVMTLDRPAVKNANLLRTYFADRYLYAHIASSALQKLARRYEGSRPKMTTKGFGPANFAEVKVMRRMSRAKT